MPQTTTRLFDVDAARRVAAMYPGQPSERLLQACDAIDELREADEGYPGIADDLMVARQALLWTRANDAGDTPPRWVADAIEAARTALDAHGKAIAWDDISDDTGMVIRHVVRPTDAVADLARRVPHIDAHRELEKRVDKIAGSFIDLDTRARAIAGRIGTIEERLARLEMPHDKATA